MLESTKEKIISEIRNILLALIMSVLIGFCFYTYFNFNHKPSDIIEICSKESLPLPERKTGADLDKEYLELGKEEKNIGVEPLADPYEK